MFVRDDGALAAGEVVARSVAAPAATAVAAAGNGRVQQRLGTVNGHYGRAAVCQQPVHRRRRVLVRAAHRHHQQTTVFPVARRARRPRRIAVAVLLPDHFGFIAQRRGQRGPATVAVAVVRHPSGQHATGTTAAAAALVRRPQALGFVRLLRLHFSLGYHLRNGAIRTRYARIEDHRGRRSFI